MLHLLGTISRCISGIPTISSARSPRLPWRGVPDDRLGGPPRRGEPPPLTAISPDGKTVAVAPFRGNIIKLYSAQDGNPLMREDREGPKKLEIEAQAELSAIALGPNNVLATAGNTAGGVAIRIWDLDSPSFPRSLTPPAQSYTRLMRFSPQGNLLAIMGSGPIELWDPVALNRVAVMVMSDQATDVAFGPDGTTLAAVGRAGEAMLWTVQDSAARTQLSGFDASPVSLAFSEDGVLAGVDWNGENWSWRSGRCPEIGPPAANGAAPATASAVALPEPKHIDALGSDSSRRGGRPRQEGPRAGGRGPIPLQPSLTFDSSGRMVFHDAQGLRVYDAATRSVQSPPAFSVPIAAMQGSWPSRMMSAVARTVDGSTIAVLRGSSIYLWHAEAPGELTHVELPAQFATASPPPPPAGSGPRRREPAGSEASGPAFRSIQISTSGDRIFTIEQKGRSVVLRVWAIDANVGAKTVHARELQALTLPEGSNKIALRPDGKLLAVADRTGKVILFDASSMAEVGWFKDPVKPTENFSTPALAFSPDGRSLAVGSQQGPISLWSLEVPASPRLRLHLPGHRGTVTNLVYDPHGRRLASATAGSHRRSLGP